MGWRGEGGGGARTRGHGGARADGQGQGRIRLGDAEQDIVDLVQVMLDTVLVAQVQRGKV